MHLRLWLYERDIDISQFARSIGYTPTYIRSVLKGRFPINMRMAQKMSEYTDGEITVGDVLNIYEKSKKPKDKIQTIKKINKFSVIHINTKEGT